MSKTILRRLFVLALCACLVLLAVLPAGPISAITPAIPISVIRPIGAAPIPAGTAAITTATTAPNPPARASAELRCGPFSSFL